MTIRDLITTNLMNKLERPDVGRYQACSNFLGEQVLKLNPLLKQNTIIFKNIKPNDIVLIEKLSDELLVKYFELVVMRTYTQR